METETILVGVEGRVRCVQLPEELRCPASMLSQDGVYFGHLGQLWLVLLEDVEDDVTIGDAERGRGCDAGCSVFCGHLAKQLDLVALVIRKNAIDAIDALGRIVNLVEGNKPATAVLCKLEGTLLLLSVGERRGRGRVRRCRGGDYGSGERLLSSPKGGCIPEGERWDRRGLVGCKDGDIAGVVVVVDGGGCAAGDHHELIFGNVVRQCIPVR
mmetsp:Transcript_29379/g.85435  ORF Transcript_29379/g.85435 Transcript_29379/m.85435 type:complete len:213 (+) Transcript_29379:1406-2044(+)